VKSPTVSTNTCTEHYQHNVLLNQTADSTMAQRI